MFEGLIWTLYLHFAARLVGFAFLMLIVYYCLSCLRFMVELVWMWRLLVLCVAVKWFSRLCCSLTCVVRILLLTWDCLVIVLLIGLERCAITLALGCMHLVCMVYLDYGWLFAW